VTVDPTERREEAPVDLAALKIAGLWLEGSTLWIASVRERLVARGALDAERVDVVLRYPHAVADVARAPEGLWMVAGGGGEGRQCVLWSPEQGREVRRFNCPGGAGGGLAFHRGRLWLTHRHNRRLFVLDPACGAVERVIATEHEVFSPSVAGDALWLVEAHTGPFGRFSPGEQTQYFFAHFDPDGERTIVRVPAPVNPSAMVTDGARFWFAPRDAAGLRVLDGRSLPRG
jgi:hypothetical protein